MWYIIGAIVVIVIALVVFMGKKPKAKGTESGEKPVEAETTPESMPEETTPEKPEEETSEMPSEEDKPSQ